MSGRITHAAVRALDKVNRALRPKRARMAEHLLTGRRGEEDAYFYLRGLGYVMIARNWRSPRRKGELDLVGWDGDTLSFIEVKTRTTMDVVPAEAAVDAEKRAELCAMAREYLRLFMTSRVRLSPTSRPKGGNPAPAEISGDGRGPSPAAGSGSPKTGSGSEGTPNIRFDVLSIYYLDDGGKGPQFALFKNCFPMA